MPGPRKRLDITTEAFPRIQKWEKERFTSSLYKVHIHLLRELSEATGLPMSTLLTQAIEQLLQETGQIKKPMVPRIDVHEYLQKRGDST